MDAVAVFVWVGEKGGAGIGPYLGPAASGPACRGDSESRLQHALTAPAGPRVRTISAGSPDLLGVAAIHTAWGQLIIDLGRWDDRDDAVQREWAPLPARPS